MTSYHRSDRGKYKSNTHCSLITREQAKPGRKKDGELFQQTHNRIITMVNTTIAGNLPTPQPAPQLADHALELFSLKGKVASVTGSSRGIGLAVATAYAQAGADVAIWYNFSPAEAIAEELSKRYNVRVKAYKVSLTDFQSIDKAVQQQVKDFGKIDIFVSNAGIAWNGGGILDQPDDEMWKKVVDLDLNSVYYLSKSIGKVFKEQGHGSYIITASMSAHVVNIPQQQSGYNAAKAAVLHLSKSLAVEWAAFARVNTVSPGYIGTELTNFADPKLKDTWRALTPQGREGMPQELVGAYIYLASNASTFTTGADIIVDGGYTAV